MNFYTISASGTIFLCLLLVIIVIRDKKNELLFFGKHKKISWLLIFFLIFVGVIAFYTRFIEPFQILTREEKISIAEIKQPIKIAFITDPQLNRFKNEEWVKKISDSTEKANPDLILFGGDLISNGGYYYDLGATSESKTENGVLAGFSQITKKYPSFYTLGNHEYGLGSASRSDNKRWTGNVSEETIRTMNTIGATPLLNKLNCIEIKQQKICFFGIDDIWGAESGLTKIDFSELKNWDQKIPLIFLSHNPDGILLWPKEIKKPDLVLSGHTHGGQIYLPCIGSIASAGVQLGKGYYRGLNYFENIPTYTSIGLGESGGPVRFMSVPEITVIELQ